MYIFGTFCIFCLKLMRFSARKSFIQKQTLKFKCKRTYLKCSGLPIIDLHSTHFKSSPSGPSEYFRPRSSRTLDDTGAFRDFGWLAFGFAVSNSFIITCSWFGVVVDKLALLAKNITIVVNPLTNCSSMETDLM